MRLYKPDSRPQLYHISDLNCDGETFVPRVPPDALAYEEEDTTQKRICVSTSIIGCIRAIDPCLLCPRTEWYVHVPEKLNRLYERNKVFAPTKEEVGDVIETREKWITARAKMKCIGIVRSNTHVFSDKGSFTWIKKFK